MCICRNLFSWIVGTDFFIFFFSVKQLPWGALDFQHWASLCSVHLLPSRILRPALGKHLGSCQVRRKGTLKNIKALRNASPRLILQQDLHPLPGPTAMWRSMLPLARLLDRRCRCHRIWAKAPHHWWITRDCFQFSSPAQVNNCYASSTFIYCIRSVLNHVWTAGDVNVGLLPVLPLCLSLPFQGLTWFDFIRPISEACAPVNSIHAGM